MKKMYIIIIAILLPIGGYFWSSYNHLVTANEKVNNQWAQVEAQYQRRFDLIPNLVNAVKGAMSQEQKVFGDLAAARANYAGAKNPNEKAAAATQLEGSLSRLLMVMENYPQLKSMDTVQTLMVQLEGTENRISVERQRYNNEVRDFNTYIKRFPNNLIAGQFGFNERNYFEAEKGAEKAPKVDFNLT